MGKNILDLIVFSFYKSPSKVQRAPLSEAIFVNIRIFFLTTFFFLWSKMI
jgi:hypothetical protein